MVLGLTLAATVAQAQEIWRLDNLTRIGGHPVTVEGAPKVEMSSAAAGPAVRFNGASDGLFLPAIPIAGAEQFTIEILFWPEEGGPEAQRFLHLEDAKLGRALIETRLDGKGNWWLDTFLLPAGPAGQSRGLALIDPKLVHPTNQWTWAALRYDGRIMSHFVNGVKELEGELKFPPFLAEGRTSVGVRQNKVFWFKGLIREVRFHREAISPAALQRVK